MQNAKGKCGLNEVTIGVYSEKSILNEAYLCYEKNWQPDNYDHLHQWHQLTYVENGYQYFHIEQRIYLVPQNHVIWIPGGLKHRITSDARHVNLMMVMFKPLIQDPFYNNVHVFLAPPVLREMLMYANKWNKLLKKEDEHSSFMFALLNSLPNFCQDNNYLNIPVPSDERLIPICNYINSNFNDSFGIQEVIREAAISHRSLQRIFKKQTGITIQKYIQLIRILKSNELIDTKRYTLTEIAFKVGYKSLSAYTLSYRAIMKQRPKLNKRIKT